MMVVQPGIEASMAACSGFGFDFAWKSCACGLDFRQHRPGDVDHTFFLEPQSLNEVVLYSFSTKYQLLCWGAKDEGDQKSLATTTLGGVH